MNLTLEHLRSMHELEALAKVESQQAIYREMVRTYAAKQVVAFKDDPSVKHPFFEQLVTEWHSTVESAATSCVENYL